MTEQTTFQYDGLLSRQRGSAAAPLLFAFQAPAFEIVKWAFVDRLSAKNPTGVQRNANPRRVTEIRRFLEGDTRNVIPSAVVIAFRPNASTQITLANSTSEDIAQSASDLSVGISVRAKISFEARVQGEQIADTAVESGLPAVVIDGQHRLLGMAKSQSEYIVNAVALLGANDSEIAFQFLVINNKAQRVDRKHLTNLGIIYSEDDLNQRLKDAAKLGLDPEAITVLKISAFHPDSPFCQLIDMPQSEKHWIVPNAIELAYNFVVAKSPADLDEEDRIWFFLYIWREVHDFWSAQYPDIWQKAGKFNETGSKLLSKVGIACLTDYLVTVINSIATIDAEPPDFRIEETVRAKARQVLERFEPQFFLVPWKKTELDTKLGRELVSEAIVRVADNVRYKRPWYQDVSVIEPTSI